jgi:exodeoxyribonuclease-3
MKIVSWNINGIRAIAGRGFEAWLHANDADIVALQEVRSPPEAVPAPLQNPEGWHTHISAAARKGYSGVGLYARQPWRTLATSLNNEEFDVEGRVQIAHFGSLVLVNGYFPNGSGKDRDNGRVPFKLDFYRALFDLLQPYVDAHQPVVVVGDFNTAHREIDLARPRENLRTSGFLPEERQSFDGVLQRGWTDSFRHLHPETADRYTWWSQRFGVRAKNIGWRIDYALLSPAALPYLCAADIHDDVAGSDHCPISVVLDRSVIHHPVAKVLHP